MDKLKIIIGYVFGLFTTILLFSLALLLILKSTIYNKDYVKKELAKANYYDTVYDEIIEEMKDYMTSSGISDEILIDLFTKREVTHEINTFIDNIYLGKKYEVNVSNLTEKLDSNIDTYISKYNLQITGKSNLNSFKKDMIDIYKKEITLYNTIDSLINTFYKVNSLLNYCIIVIIIILLILFVLELILKVKFIPGIIMSSGFLLIFIRFVIYDKIDINSLLIITDYFSIVLRSILNNFGTLILFSGIILICMGIILCFVNRKTKSIEKK